MNSVQVVVLISADAEWKVARQWFDHAPANHTPYGECIHINLCGSTICCMQSGWGKVAAAASTQFAIQELKPGLLINLGTCGGFAGDIERGEIILAKRHSFMISRS